MDPISEGSSGLRVLTARHISSDKFPGQNAINTTLLCHSLSVQPDFATYFTALHTYAIVLWVFGCIILLGVCVLFAVTVNAAKKHWQECFSSTVAVLAVYPLVAAAGLIALLVPRARVISEAIAQEVVMVAMYHFYCMVIAECGGIEELIRRAGGSRLETRVLPCCCWPCCALPQPQLDKRKLSWLRYLVLQMPIVQAFIYLIILVLWAEDVKLYMDNIMYIQPFIVVSILTGMWGVIMCVRAAEGVGRRPKPRFLALQLVLLIVKLQYGIAKSLTDMIMFPCILSLHPSVLVNMLQNAIMILEMLVLSLWAWRLYRVPPCKVIDKVQSVAVAVIEDPDVKPSKELLDITCYANKTEVKI